MKAGTPRDYSEDMYNVYFEVGEWEGTALSILESFVGQSPSTSISYFTFGVWV